MDCSFHPVWCSWLGLVWRTREEVGPPFFFFFFFIFFCLRLQRQTSKSARDVTWVMAVSIPETDALVLRQSSVSLRWTRRARDAKCVWEGITVARREKGESRVLSGIQYVSSNTFRNWRTTHSARSMSYSAAVAAAPSRWRIVVKVAGTLTASPPQNLRSVSILCLSGSSCISPPWASWGFCGMGYGLISRRVRFRARSSNLRSSAAHFNRTIRTH